ncbi:MAG: M48 family metallopeptidase [Alphaproteobacteria bacterium]|nr:M48 family metallopeptidase [Alphaproteobacteria bacterium]
MPLLRLPRISAQLRATPAAALADAQRRAAALDVGAPVSIRLNPRARRLLLRVDASARNIELVIPRGVSPERGLQFLEAQRGWIASRLDALPPQVLFVEGAVVPILGVPHTIRHESNPAKPSVAIADREIRVRGEPAHMPRRVRDHLTKLARQEVTRRARAYAMQVGRPIARIGLRDTKSRWGSCSSSGALSFSWRLILAPEPVLDYVVAHEVAHLVEMNHSPRFWRLVQTMTPDCATPRAWLKRHRTELFAYG